MANPKKAVQLGQPITEVAFASIAALLAIRLYSVFCTVHIVTWDDRWFRRFTRETMPRLSLEDAFRWVFLPNPVNESNERSIGYFSWMILTGKIFKGIDPETVWHLMNVGFFILQGALVYFLARWATRKTASAAAITFLYLSSPVVFGMNRWLFTENHVMPALLLFSALGVYLLEADPKPESRKWLLPLGCAYLFGIFSTLREYALPSFTLLSAALVAGLWIEKKRRAAILFACALLPFFAALTEAIPPVAKTMLAKAGVMTYFHPLWQWIPHVATFVVGWPFLVVLGLMTAAIVRTLRSSARRRFSGLELFFWAHGVLVLIYTGLIVFSNNRVVRPAIPPLLTAFCMILIGMRLLRITESAAWKRMGRLWLPLMAVSWAFMAYELIWSYDGGKSYRLHPFPLEHYNHPLHLRPLSGPEDMHVIPAKPFWEYTYPPKVEGE